MQCWVYRTSVPDLAHVLGSIKAWDWGWDKLATDDRVMTTSLATCTPAEMMITTAIYGHALRHANTRAERHIATTAQEFEVLEPQEVCHLCNLSSSGLLVGPPFLRQLWGNVPLLMKYPLLAYQTLFTTCTESRVQGEKIVILSMYWLWAMHASMSPSWTPFQGPLHRLLPRLPSQAFFSDFVWTC